MGGDNTQLKRVCEAIKGRALGFAVAIAVATSCVVAAGPGPASADGIGIYPTSISFEDTLRQGEYFRTIGVINSGDSERTFRLTTSGMISPWLSFVAPKDRTQAVDRVVVPAGSEGRVLLRLAVPPDAANGSYISVVRVVAVGAASDNQSAAGLSVGVGAEVAVEVEVSGSQKLAGSLADVAIGDVEAGSPLRIRATITNEGNVKITPQIELEVTDVLASVVGRASFAGETVYPGESKVLISKWDTAGQAVGQRIARVWATFGDLYLGSRESRFAILPAGALTRRGALGGLELVNAPRPGDVAKLSATFRNTGEVDTRAKFIGELYLGSRLVDAVFSEERLVPIGEAVELEIFARVPEKGEYTLSGKVNYEGRETNVRKLTFAVEPAPAVLRRTILIASLGSIAGVLLVMTAIAAVRWRLLRRR